MSKKRTTGGYYSYWDNIGVSVAEARTIASVLSGKLKVKIKEGEKWAYDYASFTINYRTADLSVLTQQDVTANLLHEAGHAKYSIAPNGLSWNYDKIPDNHIRKLTHLVYSVLEDFRIEDKLREAYPYACDYLPDYAFKTLHILKEFQSQMLDKDGKVHKYVQYMTTAYLTLTGEKLGSALVDFDKEVIKAHKKTKEALLKTRKANGTQGVVEIIQNEIYEHIKKFLDDFDDEKAQQIVVKYLVEGREPLEEYEDLYPEVKPLINKTATTLNRVLTDKKFDKFAGRYRRGQKLDSRRLYKFGTGDFKLFQRRIAAESRDYQFALVIDESGSMHGEKMKNAIRGAILFCHALEKLKISYGLYGFNDDLHTYKEINTSLPDKKVFGQMWEQTGTDEAAYNNDGLAINTFARHLLEKKATKRVMFVISDGQPVESSKGRGYPLEEEVRKTERLGISMVGFGIGGSHAVERYYKTHVIVPSIAEIPDTILKVLKSKMRGGGE